jgi:hypothetical protein
MEAAGIELCKTWNFSRSQLSDISRSSGSAPVHMMEAAPRLCTAFMHSYAHLNQESDLEVQWRARVSLAEVARSQGEPNVLQPVVVPRILLLCRRYLPSRLKMVAKSSPQPRGETHLPERVKRFRRLAATLA